jgi:hypothetical protein
VGHFEPVVQENPAELRVAAVQAAGHPEALGVRDRRIVDVRGELVQNWPPDPGSLGCAVTVADSRLM